MLCNLNVKISYLNHALFIIIGITKVLNSKSELQTHSRSLEIMPFDRPYMISYLSFIATMSLSCTISKILLLISQNLKTSRDQDYAHSRDNL